MVAVAAVAAVAAPPWNGRYNGSNGIPYTINASGNGLSISYKMSRENNVSQNGSSTCTVSGNRASCRGSGTYSDNDKTISYSDAWELTLNGDTISGQWRIDQANPTWRVTPYQSGCPRRQWWHLVDDARALERIAFEDWRARLDSNQRPTA